jgi:hypothetical protein
VTLTIVGFWTARERHDDPEAVAAVLLSASREG